MVTAAVVLARHVQRLVDIPTQWPRYLKASSRFCSLALEDDKSLDGKLSLLRGYREDRTPYPERGLGPGQWFRPFFLAREITELVRHARSMCENFPAAQSVAFRCEWFGLRGRRIADPEADWSKERIAKANHRTFAGKWPLAELSSGWPAIVAEISSCVSRLFDPQLELPAEWVLDTAPKFRSL